MLCHSFIHSLICSFVHSFVHSLYTGVVPPSTQVSKSVPTPEKHVVEREGSRSPPPWASSSLTVGEAAAARHLEAIINIPV